MAYDNLGFPEAVEALAEMLGMEVPRDAVHAENVAASTTSSTRCFARRIRSIGPRCAIARRRSRI